MKKIKEDWIVVGIIKVIIREDGFWYYKFEEPPKNIKQIQEYLYWSQLKNSIFNLIRVFLLFKNHQAKNIQKAGNVDICQSKVPL